MILSNPIQYLTLKNTINSETEKLLQKRIIAPTSYSKEDFVSSIFTRLKADGSYHVILNLKNLNEFVIFQHCKLESLKDILDMIPPGTWMASLDLIDAYYRISIHKDFIKYLKLFLEDQYFAFQGLPNGYGLIQDATTLMVIHSASKICLTICKIFPIFSDVSEIVISNELITKPRKKTN